MSKKKTFKISSKPNLKRLIRNYQISLMIFGSILMFVVGYIMIFPLSILFNLIPHESKINNDDRHRYIMLTRFILNINALFGFIFMIRTILLYLKYECIILW
jgi:hypothetical protein